MAIGNVASSLALQKEYVVPKLEKLALVGSRLWKHFKLNTKIKPVSNRPTRIPMQPLTAGKFRVGNFDGGDMGLGSGPQTVPGTISCVSFVQASQWTAQAEYDRVCAPAWAEYDKVRASAWRVQVPWPTVAARLAEL